MKPFPTLPLLMVLFCFIATISGQEKTLSANEAKLMYEVRLAEATKPLTELQNRLDEALDRLGKELQSQGNLESVLLIKKERETFRERAQPEEASPLAKLNSLRAIYWKEKRTLDHTIARAGEAARQEYQNNLNAILRELTQAGKLEEAVEVQAMLAEVQEPPPSTHSSESDSGETVILGPGGDYELVNNCQVTKEGELFVVTSSAGAKTYASSKTPFSPPFRLVARAQTDLENIRFYFGQKGIVILNWEVNTDELRIHNPVSGKNHGIKNEGFIEPGEMHDIEIRVTDRRVSVYVDRRKRGQIEEDFSAATGPVGIGPGLGSIVTVESFVVIQE